MIQGDLVRLRPWIDDDIPILQELRNDRNLQANLLSRARGSSASQVREWLEQKSRAQDGMFFTIASHSDDRAIGYLQLSAYDVVDRHVELGICLVSDCRGKGMGSQALELVGDFLKSTWNVRKIILSVRSDNKPAIGCYRKQGFRECGTYEQHFLHAGKWHDVVFMEKFL